MNDMNKNPHHNCFLSVPTIIKKTTNPSSTQSQYRNGKNMCPSLVLSEYHPAPCFQPPHGPQASVAFRVPLEWVVTTAVIHLDWNHSVAHGSWSCKISMPRWCWQNDLVFRMLLVHQLPIFPKYLDEQAIPMDILQMAILAYHIGFEVLVL